MDNKRKGFDRFKKDYYKIYPKVCNRCYSPNNVDLHYMKPVFEGGTHEFDNLIPLCSECHRDWHDFHCDRLVFGEWYRIDDSKKITISDFLEIFAHWEESFALNNDFIDYWDLDHPEDIKKILRGLREARKTEILMNPVEKLKRSERTFVYADNTFKRNRRKKILYELRGNKWHLIQK